MTDHAPRYVPKCTDPHCPCQDGDSCHYEDTSTTKAWPLPPGIERVPKEQEKGNLVRLVLDTPKQIEVYRLLATLKGLELEIKWGATGVPTRGMALASARRVLTQYNVPGTAWGAHRNAVTPRTRKQALRGMQVLCRDLGLLPEGD